MKFNILLINQIVNIILSELQVIKHGVPQNSIIDTVLFLCFLKGISKIIPWGGSIFVLADDANIKFSGKNPPLDYIQLISFLRLLLSV